MAGLGEAFRAAREARHLSLSDVSEQIHIRSVYLQSIENEDWGAIAAPVYVRGFIRTYARFLGLDPEAAVEDFNGSLGALPKGADQVALPGGGSTPRRAYIERERPSPWLWGALVATVLLVAFVGYKFYEFNQSSSDTSVVADASNPPATALPKPSPGTPATPLPKRTLEVRVTAPSWLLVKVDGAQVLEGILPAGTSRSFHGSSADIRAGNAGGVRLLVNGKDLGSMGHSGAVVQKLVSLEAGG